MGNLCAPQTISEQLCSVAGSTILLKEPSDIWEYHYYKGAGVGGGVY